MIYRALLSVDPGTHSCGVAAWADGRLIRAGVVAGSGTELGSLITLARRVREDWWANCRGHHPLFEPEIAVEWPQIYQRADGKSKGDPNLLTPLAALDGAICALFASPSYRRYYPHDWKAGIEKPDTVKEEYPIKLRVMRRLTADEAATIEWPRSVKAHWDIVDAIGVGLHHLGRFERARVFARE